MKRRFILCLLVIWSALRAEAQTVRPVTVCLGGGCNYTSLQAAESAQDDTGDLVARNERVVFEISGSWGSPEALGASLTIDGWTTDSTRYITIQTTNAARHSGSWSQSAYRVDYAGTLFTISEGYTRLVGIQGRQTSTGYSSFVANSGVLGLVIDGCVFRKGSTGKTMGVSQATGETTVKNTLFICDSRDNAEQWALRATGGSYYAYNCTVWNFYVGFYNSGATAIVKNCAVQSAVDGFTGTFTSPAGNISNVSADNAACTTGVVAFVDSANGDFHLSHSDTVARDAGVDLSGEFSNDIDGQARTGTWDIGADEYYVAPAASSTAQPFPSFRFR